MDLHSRGFRGFRGRIRFRIRLQSLRHGDIDGGVILRGPFLLRALRRAAACLRGRG